MKHTDEAILITGISQDNSSLNHLNIRLTIVPTPKKPANAKVKQMITVSVLESLVGDF